MKQQNKEEKSWWDKAVTQYQENKFSSSFKNVFDVNSGYY